MRGLLSEDQLRRMKNLIVRQSAHAARLWFRWVPFSYGKAFIWEHFVSRHLSWRKQALIGRTTFGATVRCQFPQFIDQMIFFFGVWEPHITRYVTSILEPGDSFFDIGANIGYHTLLASRLVGATGHVFAIEASPSTYARLVANIARNSCGNVAPFNVAVSNCESDVPVFRKATNSLLTTTTPWPGSDSGFELETRIRAAPLSSIVEAEQIRTARLVKIDVEGAEWQVVQGIRPLLKSCSDRVEFIVEVTQEALHRAGVTLAEFAGVFTEAGFRAYEIRNRYEVAEYLFPCTSDLVALDVQGDFHQKDIVFKRSTATHDHGAG